MKKYVLIPVASLALLSSCSLYQEGTLTENRVQVQEERFAQEVPLAQFDENMIDGLSYHYHKHGDGPVNLTVTYDPRSYRNTAMNASQEMARLVSSLKSTGVRDVKADILPVQGQGDEGQVIVSYMAYSAMAPKDCTVMPGFEDTDIRQDEEYRLGCTMGTLYARQIARPKDLLGRGTEEPLSDGRRAANMGEIWRGSLGNEKLEGETASE